MLKYLVCYTDHFLLLGIAVNFAMQLRHEKKPFNKSRSCRRDGTLGIKRLFECLIGNLLVNALFKFLRIIEQGRYSVSVEDTAFQCVYSLWLKC